MRTEHLNALVGLGLLWLAVVVGLAAASVLVARRAAARTRAGLAAWKAAGCVAGVRVFDRMHAAGCFDVFASARRLAA